MYMEDSGREKLQGQKTAAEPSDAKATKALDFDSASISKKQKEEHFVNVEGAEEKKKAAEKAKAKAEAEAEKARIKAEMTPNQIKARRTKSIIALLICIVIVVVVAIFAIWDYNRNNISDEKAKEIALEAFLEIRSEGAERDYESVNSAREKYLDLIEKSKGNQKFYHLLGFIEFSATYRTGYEEISEKLKEAKDMIVTEKQEQDYKAAECFVYSVYDYQNYVLNCMEAEEEDEN